MKQLHLRYDVVVTLLQLEYYQTVGNKVHESTVTFLEKQIRIK